MIKLRNIVIIGVLLFAIVISGCADKSTTEDEAASTDTTAQNISVADEALSEEMVGITDTEIQDLEAELAELEALIDEMEEEEIVVEDI
jgi:PBP1b-binding outer membrane lipoprotein LpoB